jgi:hypothetical protein
MSTSAAFDTGVQRVKLASLAAGVAALIVSAVVALAAPAAFFPWYLAAFYFWTSIALGCLGWLLLRHLVSGEWGFLIQRQLEAASLTIPLAALLFAPVALGMAHLYVWSDAVEVQRDALLQQKQPYLNAAAFLMRSAFYFMAWSALAMLLRRWSVRHDQTRDPALHRKMSVLSGPGMVVFVLTVTFAAFDWLMSLDPHWYSSLYGAAALAGDMAAAMALCIIVLAALSGGSSIANEVKPQHFHDLGNLLLMSVMLWAYLSFSQYLLIWSANMPEEATWYLRRSGRGWQMFTALLFALHFFFPFMFLLLRSLKRSPRALSALAAIVLVAHLLDTCWLIAPAEWSLSAVPAFLAMGGLWLAVFLHLLGRQPLLPQRLRLAAAEPALEAPHAAV